MHLLLFGIILGWGVAIPLGPLNVEIIRRNIGFGTRYGVAMAIGATSADTTYIVLLLCGVLLFLSQPAVLEVVGILGAFVLGYFAYKSLTAQPIDDHHKIQKQSLLRTWLAGYLMALLSPFTIIFWASVSTQIASFAYGKPNALLLATLGVIIGTLSWSMSLNTVLHFTRHKISKKVMRWFNIIGGLILLGFAITGVVHSIQLML